MKPARIGLSIVAEYSKGYRLSKQKSGRQKEVQKLSRILIPNPNWRWINAVCRKMGQRTTRTPIPGLPGAVLIAQQQQKGRTAFALEIARDDCIDFTLDLSGSDCEVVGADGALVLRAIAVRGTTPLGTVVGTKLRLRFEYAVLPPPPTVAATRELEQGGYDNCWLLASITAVERQHGRLCRGGLWTTTTLPLEHTFGAAALSRGHAHDALAALTGCPVDVIRAGDGDAEALWTLVAEAVRRGDAVVGSTRRVETTLAPGHAYAVLDYRSLNNERYCRLRDPRGGRPATAAGAVLTGDAPLARGELWVAFSELFAAHAAVAFARLSSPRGAPWCVARARSAVARGGAVPPEPITVLHVECERARLLRCTVHQEGSLVDLGIVVRDLTTNTVVAAASAGKAPSADVGVTVGPGEYTVRPTGGRFLPTDGRRGVGLVVHADCAVKTSAMPATANYWTSTLFAGVAHALDGPGRIVVAQSRGGVDVDVENTDVTRMLDLRLDGGASINLEGHAGAMATTVSVAPGAFAHVLSAAPVQADAAWTWEAAWCASWRAD